MTGMEKHFASTYWSGSLAEQVSWILQRLSADLPGPAVRRSLVVLSGISGITANNLGDDGMLVATVQDLRILDPEAEIVVLARRPSRFGPVAAQIDVPILQSPYELAQRFLDELPTGEDPNMLLPQLANEILANRDAIVQGKAVPGLSEREMEGLRCLLTADGVIDCGGASLTTHWKGSFYEKCLAYLLAPGPLFVLGQGVDRFDLASDRDLLVAALSGATEITLRERTSERYLRSIGLEAPMRATGDDTLTLKAAPSARCYRLLHEAGVDTSRPFLAFQYRHYLDYEEDHYYDLFAAFVDEAIRASALPVVGVPMHFGGFDERTHLTEVGRRLTFGDRFHVVRSHLTPAEAKGLMGKAAAAFGISYHSAVFSLSSGTPYLGLYRGAHYKQKMQGLSEMYDLAELAVPIEATPPQAFAGRLVDYLERRDAIRRLLLARHKTLTAEVRASRRRFLERVRPTPATPAFELARRGQRVAQVRKRLQLCAREIQAHEVQAKELKHRLKRQRHRNQRLKKQNQRARLDLQRAEERLQRIQTSRAWRLLTRIARTRAKLLGTLRRKSL
jgi:polysaccharide pyruvyl transferase WcaK-like protein